MMRFFLDHYNILQLMILLMVGCITYRFVDSVRLYVCRIIEFFDMHF